MLVVVADPTASHGFSVQMDSKLKRSAKCWTFFSVKPAASNKPVLFHLTNQDVGSTFKFARVDELNALPELPNDTVTLLYRGWVLRAVYEPTMIPEASE